MIDRMSERLTRLIKENLEDITDDRAEVINYGINLFVYEFFASMSILLLSWFMGLLKYMAIVYLIFGSLRIFAGGAHAPTRVKCAFTYSILTFGTVLLAKFFWTSHVMIGIILLCVCIVTIYLYSPGDTREKPVLNKELRKKLRFRAFFVTSLVFITAFAFYGIDRMVYNLIIYATIPVMLLLSPVGYKILGCKKSC